MLAGVGIAVAQGLLDAVAIGAAPPDAAGAAAGAFTTAELPAETVGIAAVGAALVASTGGRLSGPALGPALLLGRRRQFVPVIDASGPERDRTVAPRTTHADHPARPDGRDRCACTAVPPSGATASRRAGE